MLRPFEATDIPAAGRLLAARHAAHRLAQPLLAERYEAPAAAAVAVEEAWRLDGASGAAAFDGDRLTGYLIGASEPGDCWGPNAWIDAAGHAAENPETARDLYGFAATAWVSAGRTAHYVLVPAHDEALIDAWFRLGFGRQQVHGIRPTHPAPSPAPHIRRARRADIDALARLDLTLPAHQSRSPVFSAYSGPDFDQARAEWERDFDDPAYATFVAEHAGEVVGSAVATALTNSSLPHNGPAILDNAAFLGFAAVFPEFRGRGAARALTEAVVGWAARSGYDKIVTDWRSTNLLSSRTWPRLGFTEYFVRLHRAVAY